MVVRSVLLIIFMTSFAYDQNMHLYLLIGQSNMAGRAEIEALDTTALSNVYLLNSADQWEAARNPLNKYSTIRKSLSMQKLGPGYTFAKKLSEAMPGQPIGLIVNARGGTAISEWQRGTHYYDEAVRRTKKAVESGQLKAILWHQGESDQSKADSYMVGLKQMIKDLRKDLGMDSLLFIAGQIGTWRESAAAINQVISRLPETVPHTVYIGAEGLTHLGDNSHFDGRSQRILGERYAENVLKILISPDK